MYLLVVLSQSEDGWISVEKAFKRGGNGNVSNVLYIFEMILCFDAWINQSSFLSIVSNNDFVVDENTSIELIMKEIERLLPSTKRKQGW